MCHERAPRRPTERNLAGLVPLRVRERAAHVRLRDADPPVFKVHVRPSQPRQLALPEAGTQGDQNQAPPRILRALDQPVRFLEGKELRKGTYRITFDTSAYYAGAECFYPYVNIVFVVQDESVHYHVPLLLSPFSYSTYRGS